MMDQIHVGNIASFAFFVPELILLAGSILLLILSLTKIQSRRWAIAIVLFIFSTAFFASLFSLDRSTTEIRLFSNLLSLDPFSDFARIFFLFSSLLTTFFFYQSKTFSSTKKFFETTAFLSILTVGLICMVSSVDFLMTFLSMEMVSILSYLLVASRPKDAFSSEAGLKYILFGAVATGIMLFGLSLLFGMAGSSHFTDVASFLAGELGAYQIMALFFCMICLLVGFGFKMTIFPTQMWVPDVYQGAPTSVTAFLSVSSKAGGFLVFLRFLLFCMHEVGNQALMFFEQVRLHEILVFFGLISMLIGNVSALRQRNMKRLMAYSSIAHAGFMLLGVSCFTQDGFESVLLYLTLYLFMNFGAFYIIHLRTIDTGNDHMDSFRGYGNQNIWMSISMAIFLLSLIGLPPFSGFIAKFYIFKGLIAQEYYTAALLGAVNTVIAVYYYMKIIKWMFLKDGNDPEYPRYSKVSRMFVIFLLIPTVVLGLYWVPLLRWIQISINFVYL
ncbi:MAG: NADH-quinone oxidoreductase subunit N [Bdellovibrionales bacterium]|nr:NADH-quinone oxidoreductase subunit N [Bdellovibrionales bacterium]